MPLLCGQRRSGETSLLSPASSLTSLGPCAIVPKATSIGRKQLVVVLMTILQFAEQISKLSSAAPACIEACSRQKLVSTDPDGATTRVFEERSAYGQIDNTYARAGEPQELIIAANSGPSQVVIPRAETWDFKAAEMTAR